MKVSKSFFVSSFNKEGQSLKTVIRFIFEMSQESPKELPGAPAKDDKSSQAKTTRLEIANVRNYNNLIATCKEIVTMLGIDGVTKSSIEKAKEIIKQNVPFVDAAGRPLYLVELPKIVREKIYNYSPLYYVRYASWLEAVMMIADAVTKVQKVLSVTEIPGVEDGKVIINAAGPIVDKYGNKMANAQNFLSLWDQVAAAVNVANRAGAGVRAEVLSEQKGLIKQERTKIESVTESTAPTTEKATAKKATTKKESKG